MCAVAESLAALILACHYKYLGYLPREDDFPRLAHSSGQGLQVLPFQHHTRVMGSSPLWYFATRPDDNSEGVDKSKEEFFMLVGQMRTDGNKLHVGLKRALNSRTMLRVVLQAPLQWSKAALGTSAGEVRRMIAIVLMLQ